MSYRVVPQSVDDDDVKEPIPSDIPIGVVYSEVPVEVRPVCGFLSLCGNCFIRITDTNWDELIIKAGKLRNLSPDDPSYRGKLLRLNTYMVEAGMTTMFKNTSPEFQQSIHKLALKNEFCMLGERLINYFGHVSALAALVTGFTYIVSNGSKASDFKKPMFFGLLKNPGVVWNVCVTTSFLCGLLAISFNMLLRASLNTIGVTDTEWFVLKFQYVIGVPMTLTILAIIAMLITVVFYVNGITSLVLVIDIMTIVVFVALSWMWWKFSYATRTFIRLNQINLNKYDDRTFKTEDDVPDTDDDLYT